MKKNSLTIIKRSGAPSQLGLGLSVKSVKRKSNSSDEDGENEENVSNSSKVKTSKEWAKLKDNCKFIKTKIW